MKNPDKPVILNLVLSSFQARVLEDFLSYPAHEDPHVDSTISEMAFGMGCDAEEVRSALTATHALVLPQLHELKYS